MNEKSIKTIVEYWKETAKRDFGTMNGLFEIKRYPESLFYGHILLEKILKALVVKKTGEQAPYIHDLLRLAKLSGIELDEEKRTILIKMNEFNLRGRYPDVKFKFYESCTEEFAKNAILEVNLVYEYLWKELAQKK